MAASSAHCLAVVLIDRLASMAARASAPTRSTPGSPCRNPRSAASDQATLCVSADALIATPSVMVILTCSAEMPAPCFPGAQPAKWEQTLHLNLHAVMLATQLVLASMRERGGGAIISIASTAGLGTASHDSPEYAVAKAGVTRPDCPAEFSSARPR